MSRLPSADSRKEQPLTTGLLDFFPAALAAVAAVSFTSMRQHGHSKLENVRMPGKDDHADALLRHLVDRGTYDTDGSRHTAKAAWRALALLQEELEAEEAALDLPRAAVLPQVNKPSPEPAPGTDLEQLMQGKDWTPEQLTAAEKANAARIAGLFSPKQPVENDI